MNYELLYHKLCDYCKNTDVRDRLKRRNPNDERIGDKHIYQEEHHIIPRHSGGDDTPSNLVKMLPEEHYLAHYIRFKAFGDRRDFLAVRFIYNGLPRNLRESVYLSVNKKVSKWKNHIYFFRKVSRWHTQSGVNRISEARKGKTVVIDRLTREMIGSIPNDHPKIISGEWVNHTYGTMYVWNKQTKKANRILESEYDQTIHEPYRFERAKENNANYKSIDVETIKNAILKHVDEDNMVKFKDVRSELGVSPIWVKNHYGTFGNLLQQINDTFDTDFKYHKWQRTQSQRLKIAKTLKRNKMITIEYWDTTEDVYDITVDENHNFFANGMLVHNCQEISLPTKGLQDLNDENGEIALCTLSALNLGNIENLSDLEEWADVVVRALDAILDYQSYPVLAARIATKNRRPLGVGVINYAYYLAKNGLKYSVHATRTEQEEEANNLTHRTFEALQYYLLKASVNLAKENGACPLFEQTKYADGILPIDTYKKEVDNLNSQPLLLDWEGLRADIVKYGLRNSTLTALMPSETSSQISGATNGIEPPRNAVSVKASKDGILKQPVPEIKTLSRAYEYLWDMPDNLGYLQKVAIMQKFVDQAISANTSYDPKKFPQGKVEMKKMITDLLTAYKYGVKTLYYHNTRDGADDTQGDLDDGCAGGACKI